MVSQHALSLVKLVLIILNPFNSVPYMSAPLKFVSIHSSFQVNSEVSYKTQSYGVLERDTGRTLDKGHHR